MTIGKLIQSATASINCKSAYLDVELLMSHVLKCTRSQLYTKWNQELSKKSIQRFISFLKKRQIGQPIAYLLKRREFYGCEFYVKPGVFIPRPETETIISAIVDMIPKQEELNIIDFGSGSGCIGLSLVRHFPKSRLLSVDISEKVLQVSQKNAIRLSVNHRVCFLRKSISDLKISDWPFAVNKGVNMIVANPPYIAFNDLHVEKSVCLFEPAVALFSMNQGLYHIHTWFQKAIELLSPGGHYLFEIGAGQDISFLKCFGRKKMKLCSQFRDLSGKIRVIYFQKNYG